MGKKFETVDRQELAPLSTLRLNSQVQQYDGSTPGKRVSVGDAEIADLGGL